MHAITLYSAPWKPLRSRFREEASRLPPERKRRMERYVKEEDRLRCLTAGLMLRTVLNVTRDEDMAYGRYGQPRLTAKGGLRFSVAHAGEYVVLSVGPRLHGVDVEPLPGVEGEAKSNPCREPGEELLRLCMTQPERELYREAPNPEEFFLKLWTGKESYMKAVGLGLQLPPTDFSILPLADGARCVRGREWHMSWLAFSRHQVAVCVLGDDALVTHVPLAV